MGRSSLATLTVAVIAVATMVAVAAQIPPCAMKLFPCHEYLNATSRPPNNCCDAIKKAVTVTEDLDCLCNISRNPSSLAGMNVNVSQAFDLSRLCGTSVNSTICGNANAPSGYDVNARPGPNNNVGKLASSRIFSLFLTCVFMIVF